MDIVLSYNNNEQTLVFPVVPNTMPQISSPQNNGSFESTQGTMNTIGAMGLRTLQIDSIFPNHKYSWLRPKSVADGWHYVDLIEAGRKRFIPFRIIILDNKGSPILNMPCTIDAFSYGLDSAGDIVYSMTVREFHFGDYKAGQSGVEV